MEFKNNIPIYLQVINDIKHHIAEKNIKLGEKLPSTRELAVKYQVNPNTAVRVYNELEAEGLCYTKRGLGTFVTEDEEKYNFVKEEMADNYTLEYLQGMRGLGIEKEEIIGYIKKYYKQE